MKIGDENIERIVLDSTKSLLQKYGVKGWNMDDLAKECGMSKRTLYKIIGNKEELLHRSYADVLDKDIASLKNYLNQNKDYYTLLDNLSDQYIQGIEEHVIENTNTIKTEYPKIVSMIDKKIESHQNILIAFLDKGKFEGLLLDHVDTRIISNIINTLMNFNVTYSHNKTEFETRTKEELDFLFTAIRKL